MPRYVAFLRGMNVGGRRIRNDELCAEFETIGFTHVEAFLASGNVVFETAERSPDVVAPRIEEGLREGLGYEVPTFLRSAEELSAIASDGAFRGEFGAHGGKPQVTLLAKAPDIETRTRVLSLATDADRLALDGRELYWLPERGVSTSDLDFKSIEKALGATTTRTRNTIERLVAKYFG